MTKYQINYNRVAPDHRVPFDYKFLQKINGPLDYFKYWKQGFNTTWLKYYPLHLTGVYTAVAALACLYFMWDSNSDNIVRDKVSRLPTLHFIRQYQKGNTATYDNVLRKFVTDPNGNKDQIFDDCL